MDVISLEGLVLAAGGVENDAEIGAVMKDVVPVLAGYRRFHSWAILMRAMGHNDGGLLRALTNMHRDLKRGVSDFSSQAEAQAYMQPGDPDGLDANDDGQACEDSF